MAGRRERLFVAALVRAWAMGRSFEGGTTVSRRRLRGAVLLAGMRARKLVAALVRAWGPIKARAIARVLCEIPVFSLTA